MQVRKINLSDEVFLSSFDEYCLSSKPFPRMSEGSLSKRLFSIKELREELISSNQLRLSVSDSENKPVFFCFCTPNDTEDFVFLNFIFPNTSLVFRSNIIKYQTAFCECFLHVFKETNLNLVKSDLMRVFKKEALIKTLKRFASPFDLISDENNEICSVEIKKENVIKFYEKLQIKNNRNKLDDKTP